MARRQLGVPVGLALLVTLLATCGTALAQLHEQSQEQQGDDVFGLLVDDIINELPEGVKVVYVGSSYEDFERPLPLTADPTVLEDFEGALNHTQDFHASGDNTFVVDGQQFVVSIEGGYVTGVLGSVFDKRGRVYTELTQTITGIPQSGEQLLATPCKKFRKLATVIQKYGHMYYHFVQEVLPRLVLLKPYLDAETKILTFGASYETAWFKELGISEDLIVVYDPTAYYCADELLVPSPSAVITPAREGYDLVRKAFGADEPLPQEQRNLVIYCSRQDATDRQVANEVEIIAAIKAAYPAEQVVIFTGHEVVQDTIQLFRRAKAVLGVHGAGLSHIMFSAPGTHVVEFLFLYDPPMMFWHATSALEQNYYMVPLAQSWWMAPKVEVPTQDVMDVMAMIMTPADAKEECELGFAKDAQSGACMACPAGTYRPLGATACLSCMGGRYAEQDGSAFCRTCPMSTYSVDGLGCEPCPAGTETMFPGTADEAQCVPRDELAVELDTMFKRETLAHKLVHVPALEAKAHQAQASLNGWTSRRRLHHALADIQELRYRMLEELFNSDDMDKSTRIADAADQAFQLAPEHPSVGAGRQLQQYNDGGARKLQQYNSGSRDLLQYNSGSRSLLQYNSGSRSLLQYNGGRSLLAYGRRLASYATGRRMLQYGASRSLLQYGAPRSLLQYVSGRRLLSYSAGSARGLRSYSSGARHLSQYGSRSLLAYGRRLSAYGRRLSSYGGRSLLAYGRRLFSYSRHLSAYGRRLSAYGRRLSGYGRRLSAYGRRLSGYGRHLLAYGRRLSGYGRRLLGYGRRLSAYGHRRLSAYGRHLSSYSRRMLGYGRHLASYRGRHLAASSSSSSSSSSSFAPRRSMLSQAQLLTTGFFSRLARLVGL